MKRNIHLQSLSKDHHHGLLLGWKIRQGLKCGTSIKRISEYVSYFALEALLPHFEEEETAILPFMAYDNELRERMIAEHKLIREQVLLVEADPQSVYLLELAEAIDKHIRFEERLLFPYLESALFEDNLAHIGKQLGGNNHSFADTYTDPFWEDNKEQEISL